MPKPKGARELTPPKTEGVPTTYDPNVTDDLVGKPNEIQAVDFQCEHETVSSIYDSDVKKLIETRFSTRARMTTCALCKSSLNTNTKIKDNNTIPHECGSLFHCQCLQLYHTMMRELQATYSDCCPSCVDFL